MDKASDQRSRALKIDMVAFPCVKTNLIGNSEWHNLYRLFVNSY